MKSTNAAADRRVRRKARTKAREDVRRALDHYRDLLAVEGDRESLTEVRAAKRCLFMTG